MSVPVSRFAPTPSGRMHLGNVFCAMIAYLSAKSRGGRCLLRVEDLDLARCRAMAEETPRLLDDLAYFGFAFDGPVLYQSERGDVYQKYYDLLREKGLIYPCYCSRAALHAATAPHASDNTPLYDRRCYFRMLQGDPPPVGKRPAMRCRVPDEAVTFFDMLQGEHTENLLTECSDFVVRRADGVFAYQLAVVVDDALSGVTEVVRGLDLLTSTARQIYLHRQFGWEPPAYCHIPLLTDAAGRRLSKREGDGCMQTVREKYKDPAPVLGALAAAAGILAKPEPVTLDDLVPLFDAAKLPRTPAVCLPEI